MFAANTEHSQKSVTKAVSFNGFEFDYLSLRWKLNRNATVVLDDIYHLEEQTRDTVIEGLVYYAETSSAKHTSNTAMQISKYIRDTGERAFTENGLLNFKNSLGKKDEYKLAVVRGFLRRLRCLDIQEPISASVYALLDSWKLSGNEKGVPVLSFDPETGPFSKFEFEAIGHSLAHMYAENRITLEEYVLVQLFKTTGRRSEQIASLKVKDFSWKSVVQQGNIYNVNIPRVKQRGNKFRQQFKPFGLIDSIGQAVEQHIQNKIEKIELFLGRKLSASEQGELPLFFSRDFPAELSTIEERQKLSYLKTELCHQSSSAIGAKLTNAVNKLNVNSERTGTFIKVNPYRFRYTLGSRAASEGAGVLTIATLLDQTDTQNTGVYVRNVPEHAVQISTIMNQPLARYADAFKGEIVVDENDAKKRTPNATRIPFHERDCELGSCGTNSFCQDYAPVACYVCPKFMPWRDAPHHLILDWLITERERLKKDADGDMEVVTINDRIIVAVCQVIKTISEQEQHD